MCVISVIIPVYNGERYIAEAIKSALQQPLADKLEIIIVNDGSTDSTKSICQEYANKFPQIRLISQENQGVSVVRDIGLKNAQGTYWTWKESADLGIKQSGWIRDADEDK